MSLLSAPKPEPSCPTPIAAALDEAARHAETSQFDARVVSPANPLSPAEFTVCRQHAESLGLVIIMNGSGVEVRERTFDLIAREGESEFEVLWFELRKGLRRILAWGGWPRIRRLLHPHLHSRPF